MKLLSPHAKLGPLVSRDAWVVSLSIWLLPSGKMWYGTDHAEFVNEHFGTNYGWDSDMVKAHKAGWIRVSVEEAKDPASWLLGVGNCFPSGGQQMNRAQRAAIEMLAIENNAIVQLVTKEGEWGKVLYTPKDDMSNPTRIKRLSSGKYQVRTPHGIKARGTTLARAQAQARLLRGVEHGMVPRRNQVPIQLLANPTSDRMIRPPRDKARSLPVEFSTPDGTIVEAWFIGYGIGPERHGEAPWFTYPMKEGGFGTSGPLRAGYRLLTPIPPPAGQNPGIGTMMQVLANPHEEKECLPPMYKLCYLGCTVPGIGSKEVRPQFPLQVIPANSSDIHFKFWGSSNYDRHDAWSHRVNLGTGYEYHIHCIEYEILYAGECHRLKHDFKCKVCFTQHGIRGDKVIMKPWGGDLEGLPKLPGDWQYFQFVG